MTVCVTVTGTDYVGLYLQDKTDSFYAYYEDDEVRYIVGNKYTISGTITSYANNKQIAKGFKITPVGKGSINTISVSNLSELKANQYAPIKAKVKLTGDPAYKENSDNSVNVEFDNTSVPLFCKEEKQ